MFRRLRNRFVAITMAVTAVILVVASSAIYVVVRKAAERRPYFSEITTTNSEDYNQATLQVIYHQVQAERRKALDSLVLSLLTVGISIEIIVGILSYFLAEGAIRPVRETYESQKTFIANASHEIKTPLAAISANLEAAEITDNPWLDNVSHEVKMLTDLNQELLALSRADQVFGRLQPDRNEKVDLLQALKEVASPFLPRLAERKIDYHVRTRLKRPEANLTRADFLQILTILFDNAIKYCRHSIVVEIKARAVTIQNDGAAIPSEDLPHIFERFYQSDKSSEGVGLGLAIAQSLAERNHWRLTADSNDARTIFTLEF